MKPIRLSVVLTHPIQYYAPLFRFIAERHSGISLRVHYCVIPTAAQQGVGFDAAFSWDSSLTDGYDNVILRPPSSNVNIHSSSFFGVNVPEIADSLRDFAPDVVLVPGWYSISLVRAAFAARRMGLPVLYRGDSHRVSRSSLAGLVGWLRAASMLRLFTHYLTVGQRNRDYLRSFGVRDDSIFFSPNCVDNDFFEQRSGSMSPPPDRQRRRDLAGLSADSFAVLFAGKIESIKRPWEVIEAAARARPQTVVLLAGSGDSLERCQRAASASGVDVRFLGFRNQTELAELYGIVDALALPSESETWGLVVNEALAAGVPCVVSDAVGCAPDLIVEGETGYVVPVGRVDALAHAFDSLRSLRQSGKDISAGCKTRISGYSFEVAARGIDEAARAAVGRNPNE